MSPIELALNIIPRARLDVVDVRNLTTRVHGDALRGFRRHFYASEHSTAGFLPQSLAARLTARFGGVEPYLDVFRTVFPEGAGYRHDQLELRDELAPEQKAVEPTNADSHLAFMGGGLRACVTDDARRSAPVYFVDFDGMYRNVARKRLARVVGFNHAEEVARTTISVPVSGHPIDAVNLREARLGLFDQVTELIRANGVTKGRVRLELATSEQFASLTVNEYETLLMRHDLAEVLRNASAPRGAHSGVGRCATTARPLLNVPFVGRGAQVSRLMSLYEQASSGHPQVVLLEGEAGIGKTRLAAAFLAWVKAQGAEVLAGRAVQTSQRLFYQPLLAALRPRLEQEPDLRQWLGDPWLAELSRLLPDLRERYPDLPPLTSNGAFASSRLFEALARLSQALASQAPLLMFADDMQWADGATLDVFQYLARHWTEHKTPAMLLLSRRTETREMDPEMSAWLASLSSTISLTRLELGPLSAQDTHQIVRELADTDEAQPSLPGEHARFQPSAQPVQTLESRLCPERFAAWLFAETQGQPSYLNALLQMLLERGALVPRLIAGSGWVFEPQPSVLEATPPNGMLPSDVREMIQRRLARLSSPARDLLAAGAVLGHDFTFEELCQVAQFAPQKGLAALDEALQSLLLRESSHRREGRRGVSYHFADDKIREVVYAAAGDARRRVFHSRAYSPGARGRPHRGAGLLRARQRVARSYVSVV